MCGIIGIIGTREVRQDLLAALTTLEYRGYDSAGVAVSNDGHLVRKRASGKLANLKSLLAQEEVDGTTGIGHIRWATHGKPTADNSHPHASHSVMLVHNGIIENHNELRKRLEAQGYHHTSQTDTEVVAHLIQSCLDENFQPLEAVQRALKEVRGAYALAVMFKGHHNYLIAARQGAPLVLGRSDDAMHVGSDSLCLVGLSQQLCYLEDGDIAEIRPTSYRILNDQGHEATREFVDMDATILKGASKDGYDYFMLKEIYEQPEAIQRTLARYVDDQRSLALPNFSSHTERPSRIIIIACGTSYYAGMIAKYWIEDITRIPVEIDIASEYRYRKAPLQGDELAIFISQSGETADTLAAHHFVKKQGIKTIAIVNVKESSLARAADHVLQTLAGPEIGVASTKAFTNQLLVLALFTLNLAIMRKSQSDETLEELRQQLLSAPSMLRFALQKNDRLLAIAEQLKEAKSAIFMGRGLNFPIALEGALKLKEISYIHAEAYAAGEMKHGPIALIDDAIPVIMIAPYDDLFDKAISNMEEVMARGGQVILISDKEGLQRAPKTPFAVEMPSSTTFTTPLIYSIAVQLLAYHTANLRGANVDQPRNLAKSVTVE